MENKELISKLIKEREGYTERSIKIQEFLRSSECAKIGHTQKQLLIDQSNQLNGLAFIINMRIDDLKDSNGTDQVQCLFYWPDLGGETSFEEKSKEKEVKNYSEVDT